MAILLIHLGFLFDSIKKMEPFLDVQVEDGHMLSREKSLGTLRLIRNDAVVPVQPNLGQKRPIPY